MRINVGKGAFENKVEFIKRKGMEVSEMNADDAVSAAIEFINANK